MQRLQRVTLHQLDVQASAACMPEARWRSAFMLPARQAGMPASIRGSWMTDICGCDTCCVRAGC